MPDILIEAWAIVERQFALSTAHEQLEAAAKLRRYAEELEQSAMQSVDYEAIGDPRVE